MEWPPEDLEGVRKTFLSEVVQTVEMNDIPGELIFNWDQTGVNLVPGALWTMDKRGKKRIDISGFKDKRQITAVMCGSFMGEMLPPQLIYGGTTTRCHPPFEFPMDWLISHSPNHWSNEETMLQYLRKVIVPFVDRVRQDMQLDDDHPALAVFDHFKDQMTDRVTKELEENNIHSVLIPANCTGYLQPMDISVNKVVKSFLRAEFSEWYSDELSEKFMNGDDDPVDISTARMKCVGGRWFLKLMEHLESNPQITVNGFKHAGIHRALSLLDADDDDIPHYSFDEESYDEDDSSDEDSCDESTLLCVSDVYSDTESDGEFS